MVKVKVSGIIQSSLITAFTITAALVWKDFIIETIEKYITGGEALYYKFATVLLVTLFVIIAIYIIVGTENEAEYVMKRIKRKKNKELTNGS